MLSVYCRPRSGEREALYVERSTRSACWPTSEQNATDNSHRSTIQRVQPTSNRHINTAASSTRPKHRPSSPTDVRLNSGICPQPKKTLLTLSRIVTLETSTFLRCPDQGTEVQLTHQASPSGRRFFSGSREELCVGQA